MCPNLEPTALPRGDLEDSDDDDFRLPGKVQHKKKRNAKKIVSAVNHIDGRKPSPARSSSDAKYMQCSDGEEPLQFWGGDTNGETTRSVMEREMAATSDGSPAFDITSTPLAEHVLEMPVSKSTTSTSKATEATYAPIPGGIEPKSKRVYVRKPKTATTQHQQSFTSVTLVDSIEQQSSEDWRELEVNELMDFFEYNTKLQPQDIDDLLERFENEEDDEIKNLYKTILQVYGKKIRVFS